MPRNPIAALIQFPMGFVLTGAGMLMLGWAAVAFFKVEAGFDAAMWVAAHSPVPLAASPVELANSVIQDSSLIAIGVAGFFAWLIGSALLRAARINMSPANASDEAPLAYTPVAPPASSAHTGSTVFAHKMLSDLPSHTPHAPQTPHTRHGPQTPHTPHAPHASRGSQAALDIHAGSSPPPSRLEAELGGIARLIGTDGKFTPQQREALAKLTPEQRRTLVKLSKYAPSRRNAVIALVVLFFAFQLIPAIFAFLLNL